MLALVEKPTMTWTYLNVLLSIWKNPRIACRDVEKTMKSNQLLCGRGIPCKDEGLEKGNFLKPCLTNYNYIL